MEFENFYKNQGGPLDFFEKKRKCILGEYFPNLRKNCLK